MFFYSKRFFHKPLCRLTQLCRSFSFATCINNTSIAKDKNASSLLQSSIFSMVNATQGLGLLCGNPIYTHSTTKVTIKVFYYITSLSKDNVSMLGKSKNAFLSSLSDSLSSVYNKEVSLVFIRIHYPYLNSHIFAQYLVHNASTNTFVHFQDSILTYPSRNASELPAHISGIKIEVAGRLLTEAVIPRITKKSYQFGTTTGGVVDYAAFTTKNYLGAFTVKVWIMQRVHSLYPLPAIKRHN